MKYLLFYHHGNRSITRLFPWLFEKRNWKQSFYNCLYKLQLLIYQDETFQEGSPVPYLFKTSSFSWVGAPILGTGGEIGLTWERALISFGLEREFFKFVPETPEHLSLHFSDDQFASLIPKNGNKVEKLYF